MGALAKILLVDIGMSLGFLALAKFAPGVKARLEQQAKEVACDIVPELTEQLEQSGDS